MSTVGESALRNGALSGSREGTRALVAYVLPVVRARASRVLARSGSRKGRDARQEVEDLAQEVFVALFEQDARTLRAWTPERGLSLLNFVGLVAERECCSVLRSGRRSPWRDGAEELEVIEHALPAEPAALERIISRDLLLALGDRLREQLSLRGLEMFERLLVQEESVESVSLALEMSADAVYAWRSRLGKLARSLLVELQPTSSSEIAAAPRTSNIP